jgi:hypothetical protein
MKNGGQATADARWHGITEDQSTFEREDDPRLRHFLKIAVMASK